MKNIKAEAMRWLEQAEHDLDAAKKNLEILKFYSDTCFLAEQAAQKALKAFLYFKGKRYVLIHSVAALVEAILEYDKEFEPLIKYGRKLDQYYIPTRYPDALAPPAIPFETYAKEQAEEALKYAQEIFNLIKGKIKCEMK